MVFHISDLVQLAALDHRVIEHVDHGLAQRLGPVDPDEHRAGHVQAPFTQVPQQVDHQRRVLRRALHQRPRVLDPVDTDTEATTQQDWAKCTPSIINATRSSPDRSCESSSARAVSVIATKRRETADLLVAEYVSVTCCPTGSRPTG